jgi:hypothetical protein
MVMVVAMIAIMLIAVLFMMVPMLLPITRSIFTVVPVVLHKVDSFAASVVLVTVPAPMPSVIWGNAQINRLAHHLRTLDHSRLSIDDLWMRKFTDVETTIKSGFAYVYRDPNIGSDCRGGHAGGYHCCD